MISTHVKDMTEDEMRKAGQDFAAKMAQQMGEGGGPTGAASMT